MATYPTPSSPAAYKVNRAAVLSALHRAQRAGVQVTVKTSPDDNDPGTTGVVHSVSFKTAWILTPDPASTPPVHDVLVLVDHIRSITPAAFLPCEDCGGRETLVLRGRHELGPAQYECSVCHGQRLGPVFEGVAL